MKDTLEKSHENGKQINSELLLEVYEYLRAARTYERYQNDILNVLVKFSGFIDDYLKYT